MPPKLSEKEQKKLIKQAMTMLETMLGNKIISSRLRNNKKLGTYLLVRVDIDKFEYDSNMGYIVACLQSIENITNFAVSLVIEKT